MDASPEVKIEAYNRIKSEIQNIIIPVENGSYSYTINCRDEERSAFFGMYSGLLFIGVLLSIVFLFAAVLIIYYKQISEGYEDQKRFKRR